MKILHVNTNDLADGAGRAAYRLHRGLRRIGYDSSMYVSRQRGNDPNVVAFRPAGDLPSRLRRRLRRVWIERDFARYRSTRSNGYERFDDDRSCFGSNLINQMPAADIINLHSVAGFIDFPSFFERIPSHTPIVWTLHDMYPFTGGCHYDHGCGKYVAECGACPQLGSTRKMDLSYDVWKRKEEVFEKIECNRLHIVALNSWMSEEVKRSKLLREFSVKIIPNGLDVIHEFVPRDCAFARDLLGIPQSAHVILFVASSLQTRRKGFELLVESLEALEENSDLFFISLGAGQPEIEVEIPHLHLGVVRNERFLSLVYSAADVYVIPSLQDNLPNTILESLACGTPVIGFEVGGIPDAVRPDVTGLLAPAGDTVALARAVKRLLEDKVLQSQLAANCRRVAVTEYGQEAQAERYASLYLEILALEA